MVSDKITVWIGKELHEQAKKLRINISQAVREILKEKLKEAGVEFQIKEPDLILLVECIHCGNQFETTTIGQVRCPRCSRSFKVYVKKGFSRIKKIIKGDRSILFKHYARKFKTTLW